MNKLKGVPITFENIDEKEFNATVADTHSGGRPFALILSVKEIVLKFLFADQIRRFAVKVDQHPH